MKKNHLLFLFIFFAGSATSQSINIGVFGGVSAYNGDLTDKVFPKKVTNGVIGITGTYEISDQIMIRAGFNYTVVGGADRFSADSGLRARNLSFETRLFEFNAMGKYCLLNIYDRRYTPYIMAGVAVFRFDPYAIRAQQKIFLNPLSTEGQGISGYGKKYSLTQFALPVGGGFMFAINDEIRIALEGGMRKLFTDFLDDVSGNYADPADLLAAKGQLSVDMSYRGDEVSGGSPTYPPKGYQRGNPKSKDSYYFAGLHLSYQLGGDGGGGGGIFGGGGRKKGMGCPTNVY